MSTRDTMTTDNKDQSFPISTHDGRTASGNTGSNLTERIVLPLPPSMGEEARFEMEIYARFMRHLRHVPNSRMEIKILSSIQFTADMVDVSDALVAKTLTDLGLRAPRRAFPVSFLDFADKAVQRNAWQMSSPPASVMALKEHWDRIGEDRFKTAIRNQYAIYNESAYA